MTRRPGGAVGARRRRAGSSSSTRRSASSRPTSASRTGGSSGSAGPGNPAISDGIELEIGPHTAPISGYGLIATPGAVDSHVHAISPQLLPRALSGGVTTLITAGFEEPPGRWSGRSRRSSRGR
jgi:hypothetical protein